MADDKLYAPGTPENFGWELASVFFLELIGRHGDYEKLVIQAHPEWGRQDTIRFMTAFRRKLSCMMPLTLGISLAEQVHGPSHPENAMFASFLEAILVDMEKTAKERYPNLEFKMVITRRDGQL